MRPHIIMVGDSISGPGGISAVVKTYRDTGFFSERNIIYLSNYEGAGGMRQIRVMNRAILAFLFLRLKQRASLVHIHSASRGSFWRAAMFGELARITGVPFALHIHSGEFPAFFDGCNRFAKALVRRTFRQARGVICLTPGWKKKLLSQIDPQAAMTSLPNPVAVPNEIPLQNTESKLRLLFLGRLTEKKGLFDLFQAMPRVLARFPDLQLVVAGDGDIEMAREYATQSGIAHAVVFKGWVDGEKKERCLKEAALFVLPSHFEGFPVSILEAMTYGKPVVATCVGGVPEVFVDGIHGHLVPPHDPDALAEALLKLLADPELMARFGIAGYGHARDNFSTHLVMMNLGSYYDSLLSTANRA